MASTEIDRAKGRERVRRHRERKAAAQAALVNELINGADDPEPPAPVAPKPRPVRPGLVMATSQPARTNPAIARIERHADEIVDKMLDLSRAGDLGATAELLRRVAPTLRPAAAPLPRLPGWPAVFRSQDDADAGVAELARAAGAGEISGEDARALAAVLEAVSRAIASREESAALAALRRVAERAADDPDSAARRRVLAAAAAWRGAGGADGAAGAGPVIDNESDDDGDERDDADQDRH